jgi:hypothetical protein
MKRFISCGLLAALLCGTSAAPVSADPPRPNTSGKNHLVGTGTWEGQISHVAKDGASFTLPIKIAIPYSRISEVSRRSITVESGVHYVWETVTVWLPADTKIRVPARPELDEDGFPVRGSTRGDSKDPDRRLGSTAGTAQDLKAGQTVQVKLERDRSTGNLFAKTVLVVKEPPRR